MMMNCEQNEKLFTSLLNDDLTDKAREELTIHLAGCPSCARSFAETKQLWNDLQLLASPEPPVDAQVRFQAMLSNFKAEEAQRTRFFSEWAAFWQNLWQRRPLLPLAYQFLIVAISFGGGYLAFRLGHSTADEPSGQLASLRSEVRELRQTMALALLENPSASERMRGVSYTGELKQADGQVIAALLSTLDNDPNVNVRLSTLEALSKLAAHPEVRTGLIRSIGTQDSPLMQSAIADVMLKLQEKKSVAPLQKLLKQKDLDSGVRSKIQETISNLI